MCHQGTLSYALVGSWSISWLLVEGSLYFIFYTLLAGRCSVCMGKRCDNQLVPFLVSKSVFILGRRKIYLVRYKDAGSNGYKMRSPPWHVTTRDTSTRHTENTVISS